MGRRRHTNLRGQKYQNTTAFKAGKYGEPKKMMEARTAQTANVCPRCFDKIEWRKKYDKYKPRTTLGRCRLCEQKAIKLAYHTICGPCAKEHKLCAKCSKKDDEIVPEGPTRDDLLKQEAEERRALQSLRERDRRAYFRQHERDDDEDDKDDKDDTQGDKEEGGQTHQLSAELEDKATLQDGDDAQQQGAEKERAAKEDDSDADWEDVQDDDDDDAALFDD